MKKYIVIGGFVLIVLGLAYLISQSKIPKIKESDISSNPLTSEQKFIRFADDFAQILSEGKYDTIFENGNLGKYAISDICLRDLGVDPDPIYKLYFLKEYQEQEKAFKGLCMLNKYRLRNYIDSYDGKTHRGIQITESGMIAGAHLIGATALKMWFLKKHDSQELEKILKQMNGYDLNYIAPVHTYKLK